LAADRPAEFCAAPPVCATSTERGFNRVVERAWKEWRATRATWSTRDRLWQGGRMRVAAELGCGVARAGRRRRALVVCMFVVGLFAS
jgi:hypothetical protein